MKQKANWTVIRNEYMKTKLNFNAIFIILLKILLYFLPYLLAYFPELLNISSVLDTWNIKRMLFF